MSKTTVGSCMTSSTESILTSDLEGYGSGVGIGLGEGADNVTTTNLNMEFIPDSIKSKNTEWIEEFLTHYINHSTPHTYNQPKLLPMSSENLNHNQTLIQYLDQEQSSRENIKNTGKSVTVYDFEIDLLHPPKHDLQAVLSDIFSLKVRYKVR